MFLLLGAVYVHHLPQLLTQLGFDPLLLDTNTPVHIVATVAVLTLPGAAAAATDGLMRLVAGELLMVASGVALCCDTLCCTMLCCAVPCCAVLCRAVPCCAALCRAVPCCAVLCCAVLRCAVLTAQYCSMICPLSLCRIAEGY